MYGNEGELTIDASSVRWVRIKIGNFGNPNTPTSSPSAPKTLQKPNENLHRVKVTLRYHAAGSQTCQ
jgi:hypothetical protein